MNGIHTSLEVRVVEDSQKAVAEGFFYRQPEFSPIRVKQVVVVQNGTTEGNSTVDFVLEDETGKKFVFMITGNLLKTIPC